MRHQKPIDPNIALQRVAGLCAKSEYCEQEIREKLFQWGINKNDSDNIIKYLITNSFIDEFRYAIAYTKDKYRFNGWGRNKIKSYLLHFGISEQAIHKGREAIDNNEYFDCLCRQLKIKCKDIDMSDYQQKIKIFKYLQNRGYEHDLINKALTKFQDNECE